MSANVSSAPTIVRPTPEARRRTILYGLLPIIPFLFVSLMNIALNPPMAGLWAGALLLVVALLVPFLIWWARVTRVEYGDGTYRYVTTFVSRRFSVADIERIVAVDEVHYGLNGARVLFVVGRIKRRLLRLNSVAFDTVQLEAIINDMIGRDVALTHIPGRITPGELDRREPGLLLWVEAHRVAFALLVGFGTLIAMFLILFIIILAFVG